MSASRSAGDRPVVWFWRGARHIVSVPAAVLLSAQVGFAALARDAGFSLGETVFLTLAVWALPSQVVYIGLVSSGASIAAVALAVALSGMRFMPMVTAWTPVVRGSATPRSVLFGLSWFVAVTSWVFAMSRLPLTPRDARAPFFAGFGLGLALSSTVVIAVGHTLVGDLPSFAAAALVFLTPVYFLCAMWGAARVAADRLALVAGLVLGPVFAVTVPGADVLLAGVIGGTIAYAAGALLRARNDR